ncbi:MAG: hypothetical protein PHH44_02475 [bacterium]|nr:hypothetical protein [bacterium]
MPEQNGLMVDSDKELVILKEIAINRLPNQRKIAKNACFSLGLVNLLIKRLVNKGLIKTKRLDKKHLRYIMTAKGFSEQTKRSYHYTLSTIEQFRLINEKLQLLLTDYYKKGFRNIIILADEELALMIEMAIKSANLVGLKYREVKEYSEDLLGKESILFTTETKMSKVFNGKSPVYIDVIAYLANYGVSNFTQNRKTISNV